MTEFKPGDIVRLTKSEPDKSGYESWEWEVNSDDLSTGRIRISPSVLRAFEEIGWTVELVERPALAMMLDTTFTDEDERKHHD